MREPALEEINPRHAALVQLAGALKRESDVAADDVQWNGHAPVSTYPCWTPTGSSYPYNEHGVARLDYEAEYTTRFEGHAWSLMLFLTENGPTTLTLLRSNDVMAEPPLFVDPFGDLSPNASEVVADERHNWLTDRARLVQRLRHYATRLPEISVELVL